jgi:hypothetical protein
MIKMITPKAPKSAKNRINKKYYHKRSRYFIIIEIYLEHGCKMITNDNTKNTKNIKKHQNIKKHEKKINDK